jgi:hypothetical protein
MRSNPVIAFLILGLLGCVDEAGRQRSPDGTMDAVVLRHDGGATTSLIYSVNIVPAGSRPARNESVFGVEHVDDVIVSWASPNRLEISFAGGNIVNWDRRRKLSVAGVDREIEIAVVLAPAESPERTR